MSSTKFDPLNEQRKRNPKHITLQNINDKIMKKLLKTFLTTQRGWITRKALELATIGTTALSGYLIQVGAPESVLSSTSTLITGLVGWGVTIGLSWLADKANKELPPK